jgi:hypothetical protein
MWNPAPDDPDARHDDPQGSPQTRPLGSSENRPSLGMAMFDMNIVVSAALKADATATGHIKHSKTWLEHCTMMGLSVHYRSAGKSKWKSLAK